jgi:hypothetical protein
MARPAPSPITISAIKALPEAAEGERTWVNGIITATVLDIKPFPNKEASIVQLKDSSGEIQANFWGRLASNMESYRGTTIKITGQGISRGSRVWQGKTSVSLNIPDKAAIQITADSAPSQSAATQGRAVSVQSGGSFDQSPVRERVHYYLQVLLEVADQYKKLQSDVQERLPKLTASDIKDIATHMSMTYRGEFGSYAKPILEAAKVKQETIKEPEHEQIDDDSDDLPF